jgi:hypothetical protein
MDKHPQPTPVEILPGEQDTPILTPDREIPNARPENLQPSHTVQDRPRPHWRILQAIRPARRTRLQLRRGITNQTTLNTRVQETRETQTHLRMWKTRTHRKTRKHNKGHSKISYIHQEIEGHGEARPHNDRHENDGRQGTRRRNLRRIFTTITPRPRHMKTHPRGPEHPLIPPEVNTYEPVRRTLM